MNIGDTIEDFTLPTTDTSRLFRLYEIADQIIVLYFYPKDNTPGCTLQGREFSALLPEFEKVKAVVLGISKDSIRNHQKFRQLYDYKHHLLSDNTGQLCDYFDLIKNKTLYGRTVKTISRSTFIIDSHYRLAYQWRDIKIVGGHAATVLAQVKKCPVSSY